MLKRWGFLFIVVLFLRCETGEEPVNNCDTCGYNGATIKKIEEVDASLKNIDEIYFLFLEKGILTGGMYLDDTLYSLLPCNLPEDFKKDGMKVTISGDIRDNPAYSSHTNYTDFCITKIK